MWFVLCFALTPHLRFFGATNVHRLGITSCYYDRFPPLLLRLRPRTDGIAMERCKIDVAGYTSSVVEASSKLFLPTCISLVHFLVHMHDFLN